MSLFLYFPFLSKNISLSRRTRENVIFFISRERLFSKHTFYENKSCGFCKAGREKRIGDVECDIKKNNNKTHSCCLNRECTLKSRVKSCNINNLSTYRYRILMKECRIKYIHIYHSTIY